jgi:hypothetical protein
MTSIPTGSTTILPNITPPAPSVLEFRRVADEQRVYSQAIFNSFDRFQLVSLYRMQHQLAQKLSVKLEVCEEWNDATWTNAQQDLKEYLDALSRLQWTHTRRHLPSLESHNTLLHQLTLGPAYEGYFVVCPDTYVDVFRDSGTSGGSIDPVRRLLHSWLPKRWTAPHVEAKKLRHLQRAFSFSTSPQDAVRELPKLPSDVAPYVERLARFLIAVLGGAFLLVPIIIMSFTNSQNWRLVISSIAVLAFSCFLSFTSRTSNQEILGGAAAYAAVLVVFVGSALSSTVAGGKAS